jgi:hypothetical protein
MIVRIAGNAVAAINTSLRLTQFGIDIHLSVFGAFDVGETVSVSGYEAPIVSFRRNSRGYSNVHAIATRDEPAFVMHSGLSPILRTPGGARFALDATLDAGHAVADGLRFQHVTHWEDGSGLGFTEAFF